MLSILYVVYYMLYTMYCILYDSIGRYIPYTLYSIFHTLHSILHTAQRSPKDRAMLLPKFPFLRSNAAATRKVGAEGRRFEGTARRIRRRPVAVSGSDLLVVGKSGRDL